MGATRVGPLVGGRARLPVASHSERRPQAARAQLPLTAPSWGESAEQTEPNGAREPIKWPSRVGAPLGCGWLWGLGRRSQAGRAPGIARFRLVANPSWFREAPSRGHRRKRRLERVAAPPPPTKSALAGIANPLLQADARTRARQPPSLTHAPRPRSAAAPTYELRPNCELKSVYNCGLLFGPQAHWLARQARRLRSKFEQQRKRR